MQEIGRAGRDEDFADCDLIYTSRDYHVQKFVIEKSHPPIATLKKCFELFVDLSGNSSHVDAETLYHTVTVKTMIDREEVVAGFQTLIKEGFLQRKGFSGYGSYDSDYSLVLGESEKIREFFETYPKRKIAALTRLDSMMVYASAGELRDQVLRRYFLD